MGMAGGASRQRRPFLYQHISSGFRRTCCRIWCTPCSPSGVVEQSSCAVSEQVLSPPMTLARSLVTAPRGTLYCVLVMVYTRIHCLGRAWSDG